MSVVSSSRTVRSGGAARRSCALRWLLAAAGGVYFRPAEQVGDGEGAGGPARQGWPEAGVEVRGRVELEQADDGLRDDPAPHRAQVRAVVEHARLAQDVVPQRG